MIESIKRCDLAASTATPSYIQAATSENTRAAYQTDVQHFLQSGGQLPASPEDLERCLKDSAPQYNPPHDYATTHCTAPVAQVASGGGSDASPPCHQDFTRHCTIARSTYAQQVSSHSLRRGFATEAARLGASMPAIQRHGRWRLTKTVIEYIEAGRQFANCAVNVLFEF